MFWNFCVLTLVSDSNGDSALIFSTVLFYPFLKTKAPFISDFNSASWMPSKKMKTNWRKIQTHGKKLIEEKFKPMEKTVVPLNLTKSSRCRPPQTRTRCNLHWARLPPVTRPTARWPHRRPEPLAEALLPHASRKPPSSGLAPCSHMPRPPLAVGCPRGRLEPLAEPSSPHARRAAAPPRHPLVPRPSPPLPSLPRFATVVRSSGPYAAPPRAASPGAPSMCHPVPSLPNPIATARS